MLIIPAIDLYQKKVVRLIQGDKANCKVYSLEPVSLAKRWAQEGAVWLHLIDLSAAFCQGDNRDIIAEIIKETDILVEVGGGIRSLERAEELISIGADKLILGTAATDPNFLKQALKAFGSEKIAVAADEKEGKVAIAGWEKSFDMPITEYLSYLKEQGVREVIYTDVSCDGTLKGLNLEKIKRFLNEDKLSFIFSGGVSSLEDIKSLKKEAPFAKGLIIGKALYEEKIKLKEAMGLVVDNH